MPKEFDDCVASVSKEKDADSAYAICIARYIKKHGKSPLKKEEIDSLDVSNSMKRRLKIQIEAEEQGKKVKILEDEIVGQPVSIQK
jgi:hypothetical protein